MNFTAIHNRQGHAVHLLVALYDDQQYFVVELPPGRAYNIEVSLLSNARLFIAETREEISEMIRGLDPTFRRTKSRMS